MPEKLCVIKCLTTYVAAKSICGVNAMVRSYLVYQEVWEVCVDEILSCTYKAGWQPHVIAVPSTWFYGSICVLTSAIKDTRQESKQFKQESTRP